ncbi:MAG: hypothetical protein MUE85_19835 [Microscillaceae bacterium]|jgi:colicin import membrane protein|nr:hypothetical protein [Microscillaceae bacterium]
MKKFIYLFLLFSAFTIAGVSAQTTKAKTTTKKPSTNAVKKTNNPPKKTTTTVTNKANPDKDDKVVGKDAKGRTIYQGPRGGRYYINSKGNKEYIKD